MVVWNVQLRFPTLSLCVTVKVLNTDEYDQLKNTRQIMYSVHHIIKVSSVP